MSTPEEYRIEDNDLERVSELMARRRAKGEKVSRHAHGIENAVSTAIEQAPDEFTPTWTFVLAWLFEHGPATASEAIDATGVSAPTARAALDAAVGHGLAHTNSARTFEGRGRRPTVYVPQPD